MTESENMAERMESAADELKESILQAVIGDHSWHTEIPQHSDIYGQVLEWATARRILDYENKYDLNECHPVFAWTENWILFIYEYDGGTRIKHMPRNPTFIMPEFNGLP